MRIQHILILGLFVVMGSVLGTSTEKYSYSSGSATTSGGSGYVSVSAGPYSSSAVNPNFGGSITSELVYIAPPPAPRPYPVGALRRDYRWINSSTLAFDSAPIYPRVSAAIPYHHHVHATRPHYIMINAALPSYPDSLRIPNFHRTNLYHSVSARPNIRFVARPYYGGRVQPYWIHNRRSPNLVAAR